MAHEYNGYILGWNRPVVGRESLAAELFGTAVAYFERCQASGKLESYEPVLLRAHGGDMNGFFFLRGTPDNLEWITRDDEWQQIFLRAGFCLENIGFVPAVRGNAVMEAMSMWMKAIPR